MIETFKRRWRRVPRSVRRPVVLVAGILVIIAAGVSAPIPGPGGIPIFLIGIAILSTEFEWAKKIRDLVIAVIKRAGEWYRAHKILGSTLIIILAALAFLISYLVYKHL